MTFERKFDITARYLPVPSARRRSYAMERVRFVVAHDSGNPGSSAAQNVAYFTRTASAKGLPTSSAYLFVDDNDILECIPVFRPGKQPEKAWHVLRTEVSLRLYGCYANDGAIGIEYCFGNNINADRAYQRYVWLIAYVCYQFQLDPASAVVGHCMLDQTRRTDPRTGLGHGGFSYEQLLIDVVKEYAECSGQAVPPPPPHDPNARGSVRVSMPLYIRKGKPSRMAPVCGIAEPGDILDYVGIVADGYPVHNNRKWYRDQHGNFFWSGGTAPLEESGLAPAPASRWPAVAGRALSWPAS